MYFNFTCFLIQNESWKLKNDSTRLFMDYYVRYHRLWPNDILNYGKADNTSIDNRLIHHRDDDWTHVIEFQVCLSLQTYLNFLNTIRDSRLVVYKIWSEHRFCVLSFVPCCHNSRLHTDTDWSPNVVPKGILFEFISWAMLKMYQRLHLNAWSCKSSITKLYSFSLYWTYL